MPESFIGDLIVFGAIALFIVLRYKNTIGQKKGYDFTKKKSDKSETRVVQLHACSEESSPAKPEEDLTLDAIENSDLAKTLEMMKALDSSFTADSFIAGAKAAYDMVMDAFSKHDKDTLKMLLSKELYKDFEKDIEDQELKKQHLETTLVSITEAEIVGAELNKSTATIIVNFSSEQIAVTRDDKNEIVGGDASQIQDMKDEWVFERDMKSRNPNWTIIDT